ncbi:MAG: ATP phosphoribosyltransferase regulatory subunit [Serpentinimonas sp.]|nr:MAG: ATP phosphoribosyltransferase regulatory subunit [Comamonadaceae bacterium BICA1-1]MDO9612011.1 ATP phosphoribosyltransferase regulatory subunit [Serpentinimonas sp.]
MSAWLLPDHIADVLPSEARHIEELRRALLDAARVHGYEMVMPPLLEHLDSLLTGTGEALDLQTFKLVDQLSGRTLGLRADTTAQVARIDAHLLNRSGLTRLCYCGPVLHTRPERPLASREPLQFGAELYGHAGPEADLEVLELALACLRAAGLGRIVLDCGDVRIVDALLDDLNLPALRVQQLHAALAAKDVATLRQVGADLPAATRHALLALTELHGDASVLEQAERVLPPSAALQRALDDLRGLAQSLQQSLAATPARAPAAIEIGFDLADLRGYAYYTGLRFSIFAAAHHGQVPQELVRGGRYDEVGAVFGRCRPAAGFSLDLKELVALLPRPAAQKAIRAPWGQDAALRQAIAALRAQGEVVLRVLPGHEHEVEEFDCDRALVPHAGAWVLQALPPSP